MCYIHQSTMVDFVSVYPGRHLAKSGDTVNCHNWRIVSHGYRPCMFLTMLRSDPQPLHCQISDPNVNSADAEKLCARSFPTLEVLFFIWKCLHGKQSYLSICKSLRELFLVLVLYTLTQACPAIPDVNCVSLSYR